MHLLLLETPISLSFSPELVSQIKRHEGHRDTPYHCSAGKLTVGWGHNLEDTPLPAFISELLLYCDLDTAVSQAKAILGSTFDTLSESRRNIITNMVFNLGSTRFRTFKKLIAALKEGNYNKAADEMVNSQWYTQVGRRAQELVQLMREG